MNIVTQLFPSETSPECSASFSEDRVYRYTLHRTWDLLRRPMVWVLLNPSTADETKDDPTITRCQGFARREGCGGVVILNLFGLRSPHPEDLEKGTEPNGPGNAQIVHVVIADALSRGNRVVVGWGAYKKVQRSDTYGTLWHHYGLMCLGKNKDGSPKHPLYMPKDTPFEPWRGGVKGAHGVIRAVDT